MFYLVLGAGKWYFRVKWVYTVYCIKDSVFLFLVGCIWSVHGIWQHVSGISGVYLNFIKYVFDI